MVANGPILSFTLSALTTGSYTCEAAVPGFSPIMKDMNVKMRGPPIIVGNNAAPFGSVGETVQIHCEAESTPVAYEFYWKYDG